MTGQIHIYQTPKKKAIKLVINSLLPVFVLLGIGVILRRYGITSDAFLKTSDRLVYYIFFPAMPF